MLKNYFVKYWTKSGQMAGMNVSAYNALDAKMYAEQLPDFGTAVNQPKEIGGFDSKWW